MNKCCKKTLKEAVEELDTIYNFLCSNLPLVPEEIKIKFQKKWNQLIRELRKGLISSKEKEKKLGILFRGLKMKREKSRVVTKIVPYKHKITGEIRFFVEK